tara:strand:+ start:4674 stop:5423 length:750 start_codon:yes stop_codon:yes gene_type:complete
MFSELINFILVVSLVTIQSIAGVGVLVIGTPVLLLLNISIIETINYLLPISIVTSLFNIIIMKFKSNSFYYDLSRLNNFFIICIPFVFIGLVILKLTHKFINYDYLVSLIIILTLIFRNKISEILKNLPSRLNKIVLMVIGIVHGMTNSGGTLLSILLLNSNSTKKESRSEITLFYFFLALIQFVLFYFIFGFVQNYYEYNLLVIYIIFGTILGNIILKFTRESIFRGMIFFLALISAISLTLKNIIVL